MKNSFYENDPSIPGKKDTPKRIVTPLKGRVLHRTGANTFKYVISGTPRRVELEDCNGGIIIGRLIDGDTEYQKVSGYKWDTVIDLAILAWADPASVQKT